MKTIVATGLFQAGTVVITDGATDELSSDDVLDSLRRHFEGDWGEVSVEDRVSNMLAVHTGERVFSAYRSEGGTRFWVITEHEGSFTTIILPEEY